MLPKLRILRAISRSPPFLALMLSGAVVAGTPSDAETTPYESDLSSSYTRFFPIGVWLQSPRNAQEYKAIGINTFVGLWDGPTEAQLAELSSSGMYVVAEQNEVALDSPNRGIIKGWMQADEPDNAQAPIFGLGRYSPCIPAAEVARRSRAIKARDPTRPVTVTNIVSWPVPISIKGKTIFLKYGDKFNQLDYQGTNSNQGEFDLSHMHPGAQPMTGK